MSKLLLFLCYNILLLSSISAFSRHRRAADESQETQTKEVIDGSRDEELSNISQAMKEWSSDKKSNLLKILELFTGDVNITLIGWQNVWNPDGTLKEVKTVEFTIGDSNEAAGLNWEIEYDDYFWEKLPWVMDLMRNYRTKYGFDYNFGRELWSSNKKMTFGFYYDSEDVYVKEQYEPWILQRNLTVDTLDDVKGFVEELQGDFNPDVLVFDSQDKIDLSQSKLGHELLTYCHTHTNATHEMISTAATYVAESYFLPSEQVLPYIMERMSQAYKEFHWTVVHEADFSYLVRDVIIEIGVSTFLGLTYEVKLYGRSK